MDYRKLKKIAYGIQEKKQRFNRKDRRKAKQSNWAREPTRNPKKVGHHNYN